MTDNTEFDWDAAIKEAQAIGEKATGIPEAARVMIKSLLEALDESRG